MRRRARASLPEQPVDVRIDALTQEGRGMARVEGKALFVDGGLPGERVLARYVARHRRYDEAVVAAVLVPSADRVAPRCPHAGICGGCSFQHLAGEAQILAKQQAVLETLARLGGVRPNRVLEALRGAVWGYRRKARLGARHVPGKGGVLVGFREREGRYLADIHRCEVLHPAVGERIDALRALLTGLDARDRIPQIEVAVDDEDRGALVFRHLDPLGDADAERLSLFGQTHGLQIWLQPQGPDSVRPLWPADPHALVFGHPQFGVRIPFLPVDFVQVNREVNRIIVPFAIDLLDVQSHHSVLDLFCGLGNFTLPLALRAAHVTGVEGDAAMVMRARANAALNGLGNTDYHAADLSTAGGDTPWLGRRYDRVLLDPPRAGAREVIDAVAGTGAERVVYVSCNPATLARDAGLLVHQHGYRLDTVGVIDMFPHTAHVEAMALFVR